MKALAAALLLTASACDGGGAQVNVNQDQGQNQDQDRPDATPPPLEDGCEVRCNKRFDGMVEVIRTCIDGSQNVQILPILPDDCDTVNNVFPIAEATPGGGVSGQHTH